MRIATAWFVLGERDKGWDLMDHFLSVTHPRPWNHWAEVVYGDPQTPGYIGDMPHAWAGADYINALRTVFAYEDGDQLMLGLGVREKWLDGGETVSVGDMPTHYGKVNYTISAQGNTAKMSVSGDLEIPGGGIIACSPRAQAVRSAAVNGGAAETTSDGAVRVTDLPAEIVFQY